MNARDAHASVPDSPVDQAEKRRKAKITAFFLGGMSLAFYIGFIVIGALRG